MVFDFCCVGDKFEGFIGYMFAENLDVKGFLYGLDIAVMLHEADTGSVVVRLWWLVEVLINSVLGETQKNDGLEGMYSCVEVVDLFEDVVIREEEEDRKRTFF